MRRDEFEELVEKAFRSLPAEFAQRLENMEIIVEDRPSRQDLEGLELGPGETLFGLYRGVPLPDRGQGYTLTIPDVIVIYQHPLEWEFGDEERLYKEVRYTLFHEIGHYFGLSEEELAQLYRRSF